MQEIGKPIFPQEIEIEIFKYLYLLTGINDILSIRLICTSANQAFKEIDLTPFGDVYYSFNDRPILEGKIKMFILLNHSPKLTYKSFCAHLTRMHISINAFESHYELALYNNANFFLTCEGNTLNRLISICSDYLENEILSKPEKYANEIICNYDLTQIMTFLCYRFGKASKSTQETEIKKKLRNIVEMFITERMNYYNETLLVKDFHIETIVCCVITEDENIFSIFWDKISEGEEKRAFDIYSSAIINLFSFESFLLLINTDKLCSDSYLFRFYDKVNIKIGALEQYLIAYGIELEDSENKLEVLMKMKNALEIKEVSLLFFEDRLNDDEDDSLTLVNWPKFYPPEQAEMDYIDSQEESEGD